MCFVNICVLGICTDSTESCKCAQVAGEDRQLVAISVFCFSEILAANLRGMFKSSGVRRRERLGTSSCVPSL